LTALASDQLIDNRYLAQFGDFVAFTRSTTESVPTQQADLPSVTPSPQTPQEQIEQALAVLNSSLADELLSEVLAISPRFFEQLVVDLMVAMGYGGSGQEAGQTTRSFYYYLRI